MTTSIDTSVVLTTCSRAPSLAALLDSLKPELEQAPFPVELVIVDDGSTDDTLHVLHHFAKTTHIPVRILAGASTGVAAARNLGLHAARGTWIANCDDDQIALPGWLQALRHAAETTGAAIIGGALTLHLPPPFNADHYGPRAQRLLGYTEPAGNIRPYALGHSPATNNVLMRADLIRNLGGFDVQFTEGGEDADLFERAAQAGHRIVYQPAACMVHMLTERRLTPNGLRWAAHRIGAGQARVARHTGGYPRLLLALAKRLGVLLLRDLPLLLLQILRHDQRAALDTRCSIWYTSGLFAAAPSLLRGHTNHASAFLQRMDFRRRNGERNG